MKNIATGIAVLSIGILISGSVLAKPDTTRVPATNTHSGKVVTIPAHAVEMAPDVFSLGVVEVDGRKLEGIMFVDRVNSAKGGNGKGKGGKGGGDKCYGKMEECRIVGA